MHIHFNAYAFYKGYVLNHICVVFLLAYVLFSRSPQPSKHNTLVLFNSTTHPLENYGFPKKWNQLCAGAPKYKMDLNLKGQVNLENIILLKNMVMYLNWMLLRTLCSVKETLILQAD